MCAKRHQLSYKQLEVIYKQVENLQADLEYDEYKEYEEAFTQIKTLIHEQQHIATM